MTSKSTSGFHQMSEATVYKGGRPKPIHDPDLEQTIEEVNEELIDLLGLPPGTEVAVNFKEDKTVDVFDEKTGRPIPIRQTEQIRHVCKKMLRLIKGLHSSKSHRSHRSDRDFSKRKFAHRDPKGHENVGSDHDSDHRSKSSKKAGGREAFLGKLAAFHEKRAERLQKTLAQKQAFSTWRKESRKEPVLGRVMSKQRRALLGDAMGRWKRFNADAVQEQLNESQAATLAAKRTAAQALIQKKKYEGMAPVFHAWRSHAAKRKADRERVCENLTRTYAKKGKALGFDGFRTHAKQEKTKEAHRNRVLGSAIGHQTTNALSAGLRQWRDFSKAAVAQEKETQTKKATSEKSKEKGHSQAADKAKKKSIQTMSPAFHAWRDHVAQCKRRKKILERSLASERSKLLRKGVQNWTGFVSNEKTKEASQENQAAQQESSKAEKRAKAAIAHGQRLALSKIATAASRAAASGPFNQWRKFAAQEKIEEVQQRATAAQTEAHAQAQKARKKGNRLGHALAEQRSHQTMTQGFHAWKEIAAKRKIAREKMAQGLMRNADQGALRTWKNYAEKDAAKTQEDAQKSAEATKTQAKHLAISRIAKGLTKGAVGAHFAHLRQATAQGKIEDLQQRASAAQTEAEAQAQKARNKGNQLGHARAEQRSRQTMTQGFHAWREAVSKRKAARELMARTASQNTTQTVRSLFSHWRGVASQEKIQELESALSDATARNQRLDRLAKAMVARSAKLRETLTLQQAFHTWADDASAERAAQAEKAAKKEKEDLGKEIRLLKGQLKMATIGMARLEREAHEKDALNMLQINVHIQKLKDEISKLKEVVEELEDDVAGHKARSYQAQADTKAVEKELVLARGRTQRYKNELDAVERDLEGERSAHRAALAKLRTQAPVVQNPSPQNPPQREIVPLVETPKGLVAELALSAEQAAIADERRQTEQTLGAIRRGDLTVYLQKARPMLVQAATEAFEQALQSAHASPDEVYHLAIFVAQRNKDALRYLEALTRWLIDRAIEVETPTDAELRKRHSLFTSLAKLDPSIPGRLATPIMALQTIRTLIRQKAGIQDGELLIWARQVLTTPSNFAERLFAQAVTSMLGKAEAGVPALAKFESPDQAFSLLDQLLLNPQFTSDIANSRSHDNKFGPKWNEHRKERETMIIGVLRKCLNLEVWKNGLETSQFNNQTIHPVAPLPPCSEQNFQALIQGPKRGVLQNIEAFVVNRLAALTGLSVPSTEQGVHESFEQIVRMARKNSFKRFLGAALCAHQGQELLLLAQLIYHHCAVFHQTKSFDFARHEEWSWLTNGRTDEESAMNLLTLVNAFIDDPNFRGSVLSSDQVVWAKGLHRLYTSEQGSPIYAEAGTGKTATAQFMMRLLPKLGVAPRPVYFISPFATTVAGMHSFQPKSFAGEVRVPVSDLNAIVLVDEAHLLTPDDKTLACRVILVANEKEREVQPLLMSATPVVPYHDVRKYKMEQLQRYKEEHAKLVSDIEKRRAELAKLEENEQWRQIDISIEKMDRLKAPFLNCDYLHATQRLTFKDHMNRLNAAIDKRNQAGIQEELRILNERFDTIILNMWTEDQSPTRPSKALKRPPQKSLDQMKAHTRAIQENLSRQVDPSTLHPEKRKVLTDLMKLEKQISAKIAKWEQEILLRASSANEKYILSLPQLRREAAQKCSFHQSKLELFSPQAAGDCFGRIAQNAKLLPHIQLIFPGVRFSDNGDHFADLIRQLRQKFAKEKPVYFIYQDSHTPPNAQIDGVSVRGNKWVVQWDLEKNQFKTVLLDEFLKGHPPDGIHVMLYDETNLQGGDFNSLSRAGDGHDVDQIIFYNFTMSKENPIDRTSENDFYQALRRRRGTSSRPSCVFVSEMEKEQFAKSLAKRQKMLEGFWATKHAAQKIARKLLKIVLINENPLLGPNLKGRRLEDLQAMAAKSREGLEKVNLIDAIQRDLLGVGARSETEAAGTTAVQQLLKQAQSTAPVESRIQEESGEYLWHARKKLTELEHYWRWAKEYAGR
jgi:hypothetical protein